MPIDRFTKIIQAKLSENLNNNLINIHRLNLFEKCLKANIVAVKYYLLTRYIRVTYLFRVFDNNNNTPRSQISFLKV